MQGPPGLGEFATLVITDIQSSSKLWELMPDAFYADQKEHDRLLRHMMLMFNGREVCTEGDSFQVRTGRSMRGPRASTCGLPCRCPLSHARPSSPVRLTRRGLAGVRIAMCMHIQFADAFLMGNGLL